MDGMPSSMVGGAAGALASHQVAQQQAARRARELRQQERAGSPEVEPEALDAPVERVEQTPEMNHQLPPPLKQVRRHDQRHDSPPHIDVRA